MHLRPHLVDFDDHTPAAPFAGSNEPFAKPDYRAKRHPRPAMQRGRKWVRPERAEWVSV